MPEEEDKVQRYSSGLNIVIRLDSLWKDTHLHSRAGQYAKWNSDLDRIWLELARDLKEGKNPEGESEFSTSEKEFNGYDEALGNLMPFDDSGEKGFTPPTKEMLSRRNKQYKILMSKQLFLARLENELGKGTTYEDEDDDF